VAVDVRKGFFDAKYGGQSREIGGGFGVDLKSRRAQLSARRAPSFPSLPPPSLRPTPGSLSLPAMALYHEKSPHKPSFWFKSQEPELAPLSTTVPAPPPSFAGIPLKYISCVPILFQTRVLSQLTPHSAWSLWQCKMQLWQFSCTILECRHNPRERIPQQPQSLPQNSSRAPFPSPLPLPE
jgi:hypothetical protein